MVRFFSLYGEGLRKQLLWDACTKLADGRLELTMFGTGEEKRDFMHGRDAARADRAPGRPGLGDFILVNGGTGNATSVRSIAERLERPATGRFVNLCFGGGSISGNPKSLVADADRLTRELASGRGPSWNPGSATMPAGR